MLAIESHMSNLLKMISFLFNAPGLSKFISVVMAHYVD